MTYRVIDFRILSVNAPRYADQARDMVARVFAKIPGAEATAKALMYGQENGVICCRFLSRKNGFSLLGLGQLGQEIITTAAQTIVLELCRDLKAPVIIESVKDGNSKICLLPYRRRYAVRRVVHQKKPYHPKEANQNWLRLIIERGLRRQANMLGIDVPNGLQVEVVSWDPGTPVPIAGSAYAATVRNLIFDVNVALSGWWGFGYLLARGYGAMHAEASAQLLRAEKWGMRHEVIV